MKNTRLAIALAALIASTNLVLAQIVHEFIEMPPSDQLAASPIAQFIAGNDVQAAASHDRMREAERAMATSQGQLREVERAMATQQKAMELAQAKTAEVGRTFAKAQARSGHRTGSAGRALVIPKDASDAKGLAEMEEDMNVMAHILDKAVSETGSSPRAMGIPVFGRLGGGGGTPQNLHLEGYGAVFFLQVNFPLLPATDKDREADAKSKVNSEWEQAREEMTRPRAAAGADFFVAFGEGFEREFQWNGGPSMPYDADKVEELKSDLIAALKNAAHIRKLRADEVVTVVVTGGAAGGGKSVKSTGDKPKAEADIVALELSASDRAPAPAKLVLRVRKADAEAFQNDKLNPDEFRKKVNVLLY